MRHLIIIFLFISSLCFAQNSGITYQAAIYNPSGEELPGVDNSMSLLTNTDICLKFSIVDGNGSVEYQENATVTTDRFGMVNLLIGTNIQTGGYAANFASVTWGDNTKFLKVDLDIEGSCTDFEELSNQPFTYVPFAYYSPASDVPGPAGPVGADGADGADGQDGATGAVGPSGPSGADGAVGPRGPVGVTGSQGVQGPQGIQGPDGADGSAGSKTLINTSTESAGANCDNGGIKIEVGTDTNDNGILDSTEVDDSLTRYVCNGLLPNGTALGNTTYWNGAKWVIDDNHLFNDGQNVMIGTQTAEQSAALTVQSNQKGILLPRMTLTERDAIGSPATSLLIFQTDQTPGFYYYDGTKWVNLSSSNTNTNTNSGTGSSGSDSNTLIYTIDGF